jgi:dihydroorotase
MNHIHLSEMDIGYFDANCHLVPPLRSQRDRDALRAGLLEGVLDAICSNHSPVDEDAKQLPFAEAEAGATGLELLLPLVLKWSQQDKQTLADAIAKVTLNPARILNIDAGHLSIGAAADVCIFDPACDWKVEAGALKSRARTHPSWAWNCKARFAIPWSTARSFTKPLK